MTGTVDTIDTTESEETEDEFAEVYYIMCFGACLWIIGKIFARMGLPGLVGEIMIGILLGPHLLDFVPEAHALIVIGEMGLILLVLEAGIDVDIGMLKLIGARGLFVAVFGSTVPICIAGAIAMFLYDRELIDAFAIGASLAPTSMGIALNVLRHENLLTKLTGQLIIASAVLDDVIGLILLSLLTLHNPSWVDILIPIVVSPALLLVFGYLSIKIVPNIMDSIMHKVPKNFREYFILFLVFISSFVLIPVCHLVGSSHLLGAFLAGLMFCTNHIIHDAWTHQIKRILHWMLRIFFAATIGFVIPIKEFYSWQVIAKALLFSLPTFGKILTGIFAPTLDLESFLTVGFSMAARGEFAFMLASTAYSMDYIGKSDYSAIILAVLISVVASPYLLRKTLTWIKQRKQARLAAARRDGIIKPVYFVITLKGRGRWSHQDKLLKTLKSLNLNIIDYRAWHSAESAQTHHKPHVINIIYVEDEMLSLRPTRHLNSSENEKLVSRSREIRDAFSGKKKSQKTTCTIVRWLPGLYEEDDIKMDEMKRSRSTSKLLKFSSKGDKSKQGNGGSNGASNGDGNNGNNDTTDNKENNNDNNSEAKGKNKNNDNGHGASGGAHESRHDLRNHSRHHRGSGKLSRTASISRDLTQAQVCEAARKRLDREESSQSRLFLLDKRSRVDPDHDREVRNNVCPFGDTHQHGIDELARIVREASSVLSPTYHDNPSRAGSVSGDVRDLHDIHDMHDAHEPLPPNDNMSMRGMSPVHSIHNGRLNGNNMNEASINDLHKLLSVIAKQSSYHGNGLINGRSMVPSQSNTHMDDDHRSVTNLSAYSGHQGLIGSQMMNGHSKRGNNPHHHHQHHHHRSNSQHSQHSQHSAPPSIVGGPSGAPAGGGVGGQGAAAAQGIPVPLTDANVNAFNNTAKKASVPFHPKEDFDRSKNLPPFQLDEAPFASGRTNIPNGNNGFYSRQKSVSDSTNNINIEMTSNTETTTDNGGKSKGKKKNKSKSKKKSDLRLSSKDKTRGSKKKEKNDGKRKRKKDKYDDSMDNSDVSTSDAYSDSDESGISDRRDKKKRKKRSDDYEYTDVQIGENDEKYGDKSDKHSDKHRHKHSKNKNHQVKSRGSEKRRKRHGYDNSESDDWSHYSRHKHRGETRHRRHGSHHHHHGHHGHHRGHDGRHRDNGKKSGRRRTSRYSDSESESNSNSNSESESQSASASESTSNESGSKSSSIDLKKIKSENENENGFEEAAVAAAAARDDFIDDKNRSRISNNSNENNDKDEIIECDKSEKGHGLSKLTKKMSLSRIKKKKNKEKKEKKDKKWKGSKREKKKNGSHKKKDKSDKSEKNDKNEMEGRGSDMQVIALDDNNNNDNEDESESSSSSSSSSDNESDHDMSHGAHNGHGASNVDVIYSDMNNYEAKDGSSVVMDSHAHNNHSENILNLLRTTGDSHENHDNFDVYGASRDSLIAQSTSNLPHSEYYIMHNDNKYIVDDNDNGNNGNNNNNNNNNNDWIENRKEEEKMEDVFGPSGHHSGHHVEHGSRSVYLTIPSTVVENENENENDNSTENFVCIKQEKNNESIVDKSSKIVEENENENENDENSELMKK